MVELVGWLRVAEDHHEGTIEEFRAVYFDLIGECVARELSDVALQVQNVQAFSQ